MITRRDVLSQAATDCMKELYSLAQPSITWDKFIGENKIYSSKYEAWERYKTLQHKENKSEEELKEYSSFPLHKWEGKSITECIGPRPYEFYYLPKEVMKEICDSYIYAYKIDSQQELLNTIKILKEYCKNPIIDKYIEGENGEPGYRGYEHPDNLEKEINKIIDDEDISQLIQNKFFKFLDMAGDFYNWNGDLNAFSMTVYLGASPHSNKQTVIDNWKIYRNQDIEIDESKYKDDNDYI